MQSGYVLRDVASPHFRTSVQETSDEALIDLIADGDKRAMQVLYAGPQSQFVGLDQVNVLLGRSLIGRGQVNVVLTVDGKVANTVTITIAGGA